MSPTSYRTAPPRDFLILFHLGKKVKFFYHFSAIYVGEPKGWVVGQFGFFYYSRLLMIFKFVFKNFFEYRNVIRIDFPPSFIRNLYNGFSHCS